MLIKGKRLNAHYGTGAAHALYESNGKWYHALQKFPGALFDSEGVIVFKSEQDVTSCKGLKIGPDPNQIHIEDGISSLPGYKLLNPPPKSLA